jgi:DNA recombination protein RmuC
MVEILVFLVVGLVVGAAAGWFVGRSSASAPDAHLAGEAASVRDALALTRADLAAAEARGEGLLRELAASREQYREMTEHYRRADAERESGAAAESKVLQAMAPIAKQMEAMQHKVVEIEKQRDQQHGQLAEQIRATRESAAESKAAAEMLNSALRNNQVRGTYGEIQLKSIVEAAGMIERVDYTTQESITADSGARRPDMVVKLPGGRELAVDAKVPYNAFIKAQAADIDDQARAALLLEHSRAVKSHVKALADRAYSTGLSSSPETTVAFIPADGILAGALEADPMLEQFAFDHNVVLATPASLFTLLKGLAYSWRQENLAENAREVVEMGQELYRRISTVAGHAAKLGRSIERSVKDYNAFAGSLQSQVLSQARRFDGLEFEKPIEIEQDAREFTAAEFAILDDVERTALPAGPSAQGVGEVGDQVG